MRANLFPVVAAVALGLGAVSGESMSSARLDELRTVSDQVLRSTKTPKVQLRFDKQFKYAGSQGFILYDVARAEQHFFVDADKQGRISRMYWVQFEGYLPGNTNTYHYKANKTINLGGFEFIADAYARNVKATPGRPDSDGARARAFLEGKGYRMPADEILSQRLVHLVDQSKRNELMIIYLEDFSPTGLTASDVSPGGRAADRWEAVCAGLLERASKWIRVSP